MDDDKKEDHRAHRRAIEDKYKLKAVAKKTYYCEEHDIAYMNITTLTNHLNGMQHHPERYVSYDCDDCNYHTKNKYDFNIHLRSKKHLLLNK